MVVHIGLERQGRNGRRPYKHREQHEASECGPKAQQPPCRKTAQVRIGVPALGDEKPAYREKDEDAEAAERVSLQDYRLCKSTQRELVRDENAKRRSQAHEIEIV